MLFNVDMDSGGVISGWVAPDNPNATTHVSIIIPGRDEIDVEARIMRDDVRDATFHNTGHTGFFIDASVVPDIEDLDDIELVETKTRLPIYRRLRNSTRLERKIMLFDSVAMPRRNIINNIRNNFILSYLNSERFSLETMSGIVNNTTNKSIFIAGRSNYSRYMDLLDKNGYIRAAMIRDPIEELAERLLFANYLRLPETSNVMRMFMSDLAPLLSFVQDLPFTDFKALKMAFANLSTEQSDAMTSPMVRMFGCIVGEAPKWTDISVALENLASIDIVGKHSEFNAFRALLTSALGTDVLGAQPPPALPSVATLAAALTRIGAVTDLLSYDLAFYSYAEEALQTGLELGMNR